MKRTVVSFAALTLFSMLFFIFPSAYAEQENEEANFEITTSILSPNVKGDKEKFEEDNWVSRNTSGGISSLSFSKSLNKEDSLEFEGKAISGNEDYDADFNFSREGVGGFTVAFKQFRKYYDGTGGFYENIDPTRLLPVEIDKDLHLDIGHFKVEGILAKENAPEYSVGYEREFRDGAKSLVSWGPVTNAAGTLTRYINPTYLNIDQTIDKVKLGIKHLTRDAEMSAQQSWESARGETSKINNQTLNPFTGAISNIKTKYENTDSDLYTTQVRLSKDFNKNFFMSFGMLYNRYIGGSMEAIRDTSTSSGNDNRPLNPANVEQDAVTIMPNVSFTPLKDLFVGLGLKAEFITKNSNSTYNRDYRNGSGVNIPDGSIDEFVNIVADTTKKRLAEHIQLKYNGMKKAVFYGDAEFQKEFIRQFEVQDAFGPNPAATNRFSRKTNSVIHVNNFTLGCKWFPVSKLNVTVEDKYKNKLIDNRHEFVTGDVVSGFRAYIDTLELTSNSPIVKLNYKPFRWIAGSLGYIYEQGVHRIRTRAGSSTEVTKFIIDTYSSELTLTPADYFYCSLFYEKRNDLTTTRANGAGGSTMQLPDYKANVDILGLDTSYAINKNTALTGGYSMYFTDNFNDYSTTGLPLGLNNISQKLSFGVKNTINKDCSLELKYNFLNYEEDSNNHIDDYEAHLFSAAMKVAF